MNDTIFALDSIADQQEPEAVVHEQISLGEKIVFNESLMCAQCGGECKIF